MALSTIWDLPTSLEVAGEWYDIDTDFRAVLRVLTAYEDPDLTPQEKQNLCLVNIFIDVEKIPAKDIPAAYEAAMKFIDNGAENDGKSPRTMDWNQDAPLLFPAINKVAGREIRALPYLHWWTFTGYFMEIRDSVFSSVLSLRQKKAKGKKLEKQERDFWNENRKICVLRQRETEEDKAAKAAAKAAIDNLF